MTRSKRVQTLLDTSSSTFWYQSLSQSFNTFTLSLNTSTAEQEICLSSLDNWEMRNILELEDRIIELDGYNYVDVNNKLNFLLTYPQEILIIYNAFYRHNSSDNYIGRNGEHTKELLERHKKNQAFWALESSSGYSMGMNVIDLRGMHGADLTHTDNIISALQQEYYISFDEAFELVRYTQGMIETYAPGGYNNPLFTANALALEGCEIDSEPMIMIGDGILEFYHQEGLERDGPDFIHAHEYGHHVQFATKIMSTCSQQRKSIESTRRTEMMADAFAAYFLAHDRGGNMTLQHIQELQEIALMAGGCPYEGDIASHGTPNQRECATRWGAFQAVGNDKKHEVINITNFKERFGSVLPKIEQLNNSYCHPYDNNASQKLETFLRRRSNS